MAKTIPESETIVYSPSKHHKLLKQVMQIHMDCIEREDTVMTFMPPLDQRKMMSWWEGQAEMMGANGSKTFLLQVEREPDNEFTVLGYVILASKATETEPHHAGVEKMVVSPDHRRKGVARKLLTRLEETALSKGLTLLVSF